MSVPDPAVLAAVADRLGFQLSDVQVADMHAAVSGAEEAAAALRARPVDPAGADPARGDLWVRAWAGRPGAWSGSTAPTGPPFAGGTSSENRSVSEPFSGTVPTPGPPVGGTSSEDRSVGEPFSGGVARTGLRSGGSSSGSRSASELFSGAVPAAGPSLADPAPNRSVHELDATDLLAAYRSGAARPSEVVGTALVRLAAAHEILNCTIAVLGDRARERAAESDRRWADGTARPLEGVPFTVKDVIDVAGVPTTCGSNRRGDVAAEGSATVVARLEAAGAIPIAKDATTEFAVGGPHPRRFGACRNAWDPERWAGGSSTGTAAAVAARVVPFGIGTDVGGSVRLPSAWSGLTGLKPTAGTVPRTGVEPLSWTTETVGPIARSARDVALVLAVVRGPDGNDVRIAGLPEFAPPGVPSDLAGLRVAVPGGYLTDLCDAAVAEGVAALVAELEDGGATVVPGEIPSAAAALPIGYQIVFAEAASLHRHDADHWTDYDPVTVRRISQGITTPAADLLRALQFRVELQSELDALFAGADLAVVPTTPATAPRLPDCTVDVNGVEYPLYAAQSRSTMLGNLTGAPGLAVPTGIAPDGCPTSAQLIVPPHREAVALAVAAWFQQRTDHHLRLPPVAEQIACATSDR